MADRRCGGQDTSHALRARLTDQDAQGTDEKTHGPENISIHVESIRCVYIAKGLKKLPTYFVWRI